MLPTLVVSTVSLSVCDALERSTLVCAWFIVVLHLLVPPISCQCVQFREQLTVHVLYVVRALYLQEP